MNGAISVLLKYLLHEAHVKCKYECRASRHAQQAAHVFPQPSASVTEKNLILKGYRAPPVFACWIINFAFLFSARPCLH